MVVLDLEEGVNVVVVEVQTRLTLLLSRVAGVVGSL